MDTRATWGLWEKPARVPGCELGIWFWENLRADVGFEGAPKEAGREMQFDSIPLKRGHLLGPRPRKQSIGMHGLKGSKRWNLMGESYVRGGLGSWFREMAGPEKGTWNAFRG